MSKTPIVEVINFGDELLVGIRENSHLTYLGAQLARYGLPIHRSRVITDEAEEIKRAFLEAWANSDIVSNISSMVIESNFFASGTILGSVV